ncbi:BatD family protein [Sulfurimonas sp. SAG-AH-194-C21]|nr:BatD family protein [Sulfurimonas sp. SAG-AH-194-C21]MDF1882927.1 BatD family protein [Sulfurimonas sp. SAG-AH-194-C21]
MKNLGKILTLLILFLSSLNASVTASVTPNDVYAGDMTSYVLTISGSNVDKPVISDICGNTITATGSQTSIQSINGEYKKSYSLTYQFTPKESCTISAVGVMIDGKTEYSNSVSVNVLPRTQDLSADFVLEFETSAKELYVGEPFSITLLLKQKRGAQVVDSKFTAPAFKGFWIKSESKAQRTQDSEYLTTKIVYELAAQREGTHSIDAAELKIASRVGSNNWAGRLPQIRWRTYYSNQVDFRVKALPQNVKIIGDFTIKASVEKGEINPNEALNLKIEIKGSGNFEDIESFKPFVSDVNVFDEKIQLLKDSLSQKIVFVSEQDFIIPVFTLKYFDINTKEVKTIQTEPIEIKVKGNVSKKELSITRDEAIAPKIVETAKTVVVEKNNYLYLSLAFILGLAMGIVGMFLKSRNFSKKSKGFDIKDEKVLLIKLLPFKDRDQDVEALVKVLENNIYSKEKVPLDKKSLKAVFKKYDIS